MPTSSSWEGLSGPPGAQIKSSPWPRPSSPPELVSPRPLYSGSLDSVSPGFADLNATAAISSGSDPSGPEVHFHELSGLSIDEFWQTANADSVGLGKDELAGVLLAIGIKCNYGMAPGISATRAHIGAFWRSLQLADLALAHACALGRDAAWQQFMARYR